jgi:MFS family permease
MATFSLARPRSALSRSATLSALRYPNFRLYFLGQLISLSGTWMQVVAQGWLVFHLTQSELWLGIVACAAGLPALVLSPFAGVVVDRFPRRRLLIISQFLQMILAFILAALTFANVVQVWHIVMLAFALGMVNAFDAPSRHAIIVDMVGHTDLPSGVALNSVMFNGSRVFGPIAAGVALAEVGPAWCFLLNGLSFLAVIFMLYIIRIPNAMHGSGDTSPFQRLKDGLEFARSHATIAPLLLLAVVGSFLTGNLSTLLPAFADTVLHSPEEAYAAMTTAMGIGAVLSATVMAYLARRIGRGHTVTSMVAVVLLSALLFSLSTSTPAAVFFAGTFGFGIILEFVTVNTLIQNEVPDHFRGRVMSLYTLTWFGIAPFGSLLLGVTAQVIGSPAAIAIFVSLGSIICAAILWRSPRVRQLP